VAHERNVFDWIQVALLDSISETSPAAPRRRDAALDLRLLRSECRRAEAILSQEQSSAIDSLQVTLRM
jgi:hypothetical protein